MSDKTGGSDTSSQARTRMARMLRSRGGEVDPSSGEKNAQPKVPVVHRPPERQANGKEKRRFKKERIETEDKGVAQDTRSTNAIKAMGQDDDDDIEEVLDDVIDDICRTGGRGKATRDFLSQGDLRRVLDVATDMFLQMKQQISADGKPAEGGAEGVKEAVAAAVAAKEQASAKQLSAASKPHSGPGGGKGPGPTRSQSQHHGTHQHGHHHDHHHGHHGHGHHHKGGHAGMHITQDDHFHYQMYRTALRSTMDQLGFSTDKYLDSVRNARGLNNANRAMSVGNKKGGKQQTTKTETTSKGGKKGGKRKR